MVGEAATALDRVRFTLHAREGCAASHAGIFV
jgi:hypothetical protein